MYFVSLKKKIIAKYFTKLSQNLVKKKMYKKNKHYSGKKPDPNQESNLYSNNHTLDARISTNTTND